MLEVFMQCPQEVPLPPCVWGSVNLTAMASPAPTD